MYFFNINYVVYSKNINNKCIILLISNFDLSI